MSSEVPAHFWRWIKNLPFLALQAQAPAETQGSPSEPAAARHRRCGDSRSSSPRQTPPFMGLSRKQDGVSETCSLRSPPDPTSRTQTLRTGVFFTNSLYFLDRVPQQLFLLYQPHVISWMSSSDFSTQITCTWTGMTGCWQRRRADNRSGENPCQALCVQLLSQFNSLRYPHPTNTGADDHRKVILIWLQPKLQIPLGSPEHFSHMTSSPMPLQQIAKQTTHSGFPKHPGVVEVGRR